jgi:hypothetical protein
MATILLGDQNKELLWNILYSNKTFESIPQSKFNNIKIIFENAIIKVVNTNLEMLESTTNINTIKTLVTQLNKVILQNIIADIANFNKLLLTGTNVKTNYKTETLETFEKQYKEKQVSFNELIAKKEPPPVNFEEIKDDTLEESELDKLLKNIQQERLKDIAPPIIYESILKKQEKQEKQENLEEVDLNVFEKDIVTENVIQEPSKKKKITTIEELLYDSQNIPEKKDNISLLVSIDSKLTLLMANQQKILEKLGLIHGL